MIFLIFFFRSTVVAQYWVVHCPANRTDCSNCYGFPVALCLALCIPPVGSPRHRFITLLLATWFLCCWIAVKLQISFWSWKKKGALTKSHCTCYQFKNAVKPQCFKLFFYEEDHWMKPRASSFPEQKKTTCMKW